MSEDFFKNMNQELWFIKLPVLGDNQNNTALVQVDVLLMYSM